MLSSPTGKIVESKLRIAWSEMESAKLILLKYRSLLINFCLESVPFDDSNFARTEKHMFAILVWNF